jgi:methionyl-tRNA formyltransferase
MVQLVYFGTTNFAAHVLKTLATAKGFSVLAVVTRPGKPTGRKQIIEESPVSMAAKELGLPVFDPDSLKDFTDERLAAADVFVVYAYGALIPQRILDLPKHGSINLHPSLLPKYRGPTPIQTAILNGDSETAMSFMLLDDKMDHGPILQQTNMPIGPDDTTETLTAKLVASATPELLELIPAWVEGKIKAVPQDGSKAVICKAFTRDDGKVDWNSPASHIYNQFRALTPWPGIWTTAAGVRLKLLNIKPFNGSHGLKSGGALLEGKQLFIGTSSGEIEALQLQLEGGKPQTAPEFIIGNRNLNKQILGT